AAPGARAALTEHAHAMADAAGTGDRAAFVAADAAFHRALLTASGNGMFAQLAEVTEELLTARRDLALMPPDIDMAAVHRHQEVASAVAAGRPTDAAQAVVRIVNAAHNEVERLLEGGGPCAYKG
ncbi:FCD domain-containing protein, partial [Streptomyces sp. NPDC000151]|uniref:FCD domain-containing protein n=1 Tax=Streptomyces sp. NPDC000151 TaxID=3154244 RepID=UPI0033199A44